MAKKRKNNSSYLMYKKVFDEIIRNMPGIVLAMMGGLVRLLSSKENLSLVVLVTEFLMSAFSGIIVFLLIYDFNFSIYIKAALIGISGYCSRDILNLLRTKTLKNFKKL